MTPILVIDDSERDLQAAVRLLSAAGHVGIKTARNAQEGLLYLEKQPSMLVVTDLHMPTMGGLELLHIVRGEYPASPVIVMTARGSEELAASALNAGASGYVPKRLLSSQLAPIVKRTLNSLAARREQRRLEEALDFTETRFVINNELELFQPIVGYLQEKICRLLHVEDNDLLRIGVAIEEALTNAIYHGNLEVGSDLRESTSDGFHRLVDQRLRQPPYAARQVQVSGRVSSEEFVCVIRDEGLGFDVNAVPNPLAPENLDKASGRGLFLIRSFMDDVRHNSEGNEITLVKRRLAAAPGA